MIKIDIQNKDVSEIVTKAFYRSFTRGQVNVTDAKITLLVIDEFKPSPFSKIIVFGPYPQTLAALEKKIGVFYQGTIHYLPHELTQNFHLKQRAFQRYDFTSEWNNLGYGKIAANSDSIWGVVDAAGLQDEASFVSVFDTPNQSVLWINRRVGLVDGFDWRLIEDFISSYRHSELSTLPVLSEIPSGYLSAGTMRIDCDEAILSGKPLYELYRKYNFPLSLGIKTEQDFNKETLDFIQELISTGGSVLTHSHTHAPDWGEPSDKPGPKSRGDTLFEVTTSLGILKSKLPSYNVRYAVSPFHQNPRASVLKLKLAGIDGFISGIICNDPEYLMARGGEVPFAEGIISHSEQCMFHGDCYHHADNSISIYADALQSAVCSGTFFGFLDHPFSNYQYGWHSEQERLNVHEEFLKIIAKLPKHWNASSSDTLDFFWDKSQLSIQAKDGQIQGRRISRRSQKSFSARWKGKTQLVTT